MAILNLLGDAVLGKQQRKENVCNVSMIAQDKHDT
jgi:hypothetical protein